MTSGNPFPQCCPVTSQSTGHVGECDKPAVVGLFFATVRHFSMKEQKLMRTHLLSSHRWLVALSAIYTPVALQELAGVNVTPAAYACIGAQTGGGGGC